MADTSTSGPNVLGRPTSYLSLWLAHIGASPPGISLAIAPTHRSLEVDVVGPVLGESRDRRTLYYPAAGTLVIYGRKVRMLAASDPRAEAKLRGVCPWAVLVANHHDIPARFMSMLESRMSRGGSRVFLAQVLNRGRSPMMTGRVTHLG